jgi:predicted NBD/HSP70 family sugar kinase
VAGTPGTPRLLRAINDRAALELLLEHGPLSRPRLGELTGLSKPTASQLLSRLEDAGLVVPTGIAGGGPGPNAVLYEVNPSAAYVGGLDVTPVRIRAAVADITGRVVGEYELATPRRGPHDAVAQVGAALDGALSRPGLDRDRLHRVVIGTPGAFDPTTGRLRYARHLPGWHSPHLLGELAAALGVPLEVDNDVNLAAVAEQRVGHARDSQNFVLLWGAEGLGAAVVIGGRLHRGATGGAGEVGFLPVPGTPLVRNVGRNNAGGFQALAGAQQVLALARQHGITARTPEDAVAQALGRPGGGDVVLTEFAQRLAVGLAAVVALIDPELVVLTGEVILAGGERLRALVQAELADLAVSRPRIVLSGVPTDQVLSGAIQSALVTTRDEVFDTAATPAARTTTT